MVGCLSVESNPSCSRLALLWNNTIFVDLLSYSGLCTLMLIPIRNIKHGNLLTIYKKSLSLPWFLGGDLNEILTDNEKQRGPRRARSKIDNFQTYLSNNNALILLRFWRDLIDFLLHPIGSNIFLRIEHLLSSKLNRIIAPYTLILHTFLLKIHTAQFLNFVLNSVGLMTKIVLPLFTRFDLLLMALLLTKLRPLVPVLMTGNLINVSSLHLVLILYIVKSM
ncbi:hypothetical protein GQ457_03G022870 [Hibiscus cannabinus]